MAWHVRKNWLRVGIGLAAYLAACSIFVAVRDRSLFVSVLAILPVAGTALQLHDIVRRQLGGGDRTLAARLAPGAVLPIAGGALIVAWRIGLGDGWGFFGIAILYLGLGLIVEQLRAEPGFAERWGVRILGACAALSLLGLITMAFFAAAVWAVLLGLLAAPVGLSLVSGARNRALRHGKGPPPGVLAAAGLALFAAGLVAMLALGVSAAYVLVLGAVLFVLVLAIAARSNADVVLVVAMAAVVWTLTHRSVPLTDAVTAADGETVIVALGDSYISGEGADEFFEGTNNKGNSDKGNSDKGDSECRRAPTAYPALLMLEHHPAVPGDLAFLACSGAGAAEVGEQLRQLGELRDDLELDVKFVLLSVGGNDALFGSVGLTCLMPGNCSELGPAWSDNLEQVGETLDALYGEVRHALGDVPVLVVPYPIPIREAGCGHSVFSDNEHRFLHDFTVRLNGVVKRAAAAARFHFVDTIPDALAGRRLCDGPASEVGVNFLAANSVVGTLEQAIYPLNWLHNSLHPNARGHELMRGAVVRWLDEHPDLDVIAAPEPDADVDTPVDTNQRCRGRRGADLRACTNRWAREKSSLFLLTRGPIGVGVALGAWLLALPLIRLWRIIFGD